jgi:hypothetical protein
MENGKIEVTAKRYCRLLNPVRDRHGVSRFRDRPRILSELVNLGRHMYLVQFEDGGTTFVFDHEVDFDDVTN